MRFTESEAFKRPPLRQSVPIVGPGSPADLARAAKIAFRSYDEAVRRGDHALAEAARQRFLTASESIAAQRRARHGKE